LEESCASRRPEFLGMLRRVKIDGSIRETNTLSDLSVIVS
jgi:hypothetical protein